MVLLGFDVGGSSVKHAVVGEHGTLLEKGKFVTPDTLEKFYEKIAETYQNYKKHHEIIGVGFSMPGAVDNQNGIIGGSSAVPYIHNFNIKDELRDLLNIPIAMENDANCAALGEVWVGAARDYNDVAFLVIGSGVGGALVKNHKIHHGCNLHGGEFGYMVVDDDFHILSEVAATGGMAKNIARAKNLPENEINGEIAFKLMEQGDYITKCEIEKMYAHLARGIYNIQYCFDPEIFVIGGAISIREDFIENIDRHIQMILDKVEIAKIKPKVVNSQYGNDANILGAVYNFQNICD